MTPKKQMMIGANLAVVGVLAWAVSGDITGSAHDFSSAGFADGQICLPCHTPHNSNTDVERAPLWNHALTTSTFDMHSGPGYATEDALDGGSILCMSCHDGTVSLDAFGGTTGTPGLTIIGDENLGTDLTNDHPVGVDAIYRNFPWMNDPANWEGRAAGNPRKFTLKPMTVAGVEEQVVGCSTCHEPHNGEDTSTDHLLQLPLAGSQLCLQCHLK